MTRLLLAAAAYAVGFFAGVIAEFRAAERHRQEVTGLRIP